MIFFVILPMKMYFNRKKAHHNTHGNHRYRETLPKKKYLKAISG